MAPDLLVVFVPAPGIGHLISTVEFAKRLLSLIHPGRRLSATILVMPPPHPSCASTTFIDSVVSSSPSIHFERLPLIDLPCNPTGQKGATITTRLAESSKPLVKAALSRHLSAAPIAAVILDLFCTSIIDVAAELHIPAYIYYTSSAAFLGAMLYLPTLNKRDDDIDNHIHIPTLPPVPPHCMPQFMTDKKEEAYAIFLEHGRRFRDAKAIIVDTFAELEPRAIKALADGECVPGHPTPTVLPVGPVLAMDKAEPEHKYCIERLDMQPAGSVVFLCFGSIGSFGTAHAREMAAGLERSGHRFLWALRSPAKLEEVLPDGFLERMEGRGLVWSSWVPQVDILGHSAVRGFVTHCGWNSVLEGLWFGVPMLGLPLYAEQRLNCFQMVTDLGVALELKSDYENGGFVSAEEMERGVRCLMEECEHGNKVRAKVEEMKLAARRAVKEGGPSYDALQRFLGDLEKER